MDRPASWLGSVSESNRGRVAVAVGREADNAVSQVVETQIWHPPVPVGRRAQQRNSGFCQHFCLGVSCPISHLLKPGNSVPPMWPWHLSSCCSSAGAQSKCVRVSLCTGSLRGMPGTPEALHLPQPQSGFHSQKLWRLLFCAPEPWAGEPYVGPGLLTPQGGPP